MLWRTTAVKKEYLRFYGNSNKRGVGRDVIKRDSGIQFPGIYRGIWNSIKYVKYGQRSMTSSSEALSYKTAIVQNQGTFELNADKIHTGKPAWSV